MTGSDAGRVVCWLIALTEGNQYPALYKRIADGAEAEGLAVTPLVPEPLLAEAEREIEQMQDEAVRDIAGKLRAELQCRKLQAQVDAVRKIADDIAIYAGDDEGSRLDRLAAHWTTEIRAALGETHE